MTQQFRALEYPSLICSGVLDLFSRGETLPRAEEICQLALNGWSVPSGAILDAERTVFTTGIARTGSIFVLDIEDMAALQDLERDAPELPPLPFPRCWFEVWDSDRGAPTTIQSFTDLDGRKEWLIAYAVLETRPSAEWMIFGVLRSEGTDESHHAISIRGWGLRVLVPDDLEKGVAIGPTDRDLSPVGVVLLPEDQRILAGLDSESQQRIQNIFRGPLDLAQLINVLGAKHTTYSMPRARRREFQRRYRQSAPTIYLVNLRSAGSDEPGHGDRIYRHRWLVRGHYRRHPDGQHLVPGRGPCTWVRPYVKGPPGAPWKGRGIYSGGHS